MASKGRYDKSPHVAEKAAKPANKDRAEKPNADEKTDKGKGTKEPVTKTKDGADSGKESKAPGDKGESDLADVPVSDADMHGRHQRERDGLHHQQMMEHSEMRHRHEMDHMTARMGRTPEV